MVRAEGLEPSRTLRSNGFSYLPTACAAPGVFARVWGLDYPFTMSVEDLGAARLVSTPSRPFRRAWLGIAISQGSPNLSSSTSPVSQRALKFALKSDASADSATPARFQR